MFREPFLTKKVLNRCDRFIHKMINIDRKINRQGRTALLYIFIYTILY